MLIRICNPNIIGQRDLQSPLLHGASLPAGQAGRWDLGSAKQTETP